VLIAGYTSLHLFGVLPDYRGIAYAKNHVTDKNAIVGAGLAIQSEWYVSGWDDPSNPFSGSYGPAQVSPQEMEDLHITDPHDPETAVTAMDSRIAAASAACTQCNSSTDLFIVAAIAQNLGFSQDDYKFLPMKDGKINWDDVMLGLGGNTGDDLARLRQNITNKNYNTQFMLKLFTMDIKKLLDAGFTLPEEYADVDWNEIDRLINLKKTGR
jgi:hypothetical protein